MHQDEYEDENYYEASRSRFLPGKSVRERKEAIMRVQEPQPCATVGAARASSVPNSWSPDQALFRKEGEYWTLGYAGQFYRLKDTQGFAHLAQLLRSPGTEFHALDLVRGSATSPLAGRDAEAPVPPTGPAREARL